MYTQVINVNCPRCGSSSLKTIIERNGKEYDLCGGICGTLCLGPPGLLCGLCGGGSTTRTYHICNQCGLKFLR